MTSGAWEASLPSDGSKLALFSMSLDVNIHEKGKKNITTHPDSSSGHNTDRDSEVPCTWEDQSNAEDPLLLVRGDDLGA